MGTLLPAVVLSICALPSLALATQPAGWFLAGSDPASYTMTRDTQVRHGTSPSGELASTRASKGFGTMMQVVDAVDYTGKRMRLSGWVKAKSVTDWAGMWMRVDGGGSPAKAIAFDNMQSRPIKGTRDWRQYDVVLDVAPEAKSISFGILLGGEGRVWLSDVKFEPVPTTVPTTESVPRAPSRKPANLDFGH